MNIKLETLIAIRYFRSRRDETLFQLVLYFLFGYYDRCCYINYSNVCYEWFRAQLIDKIVGINGHLILYFNDDSYKQSDVIEKIENIEILQIYLKKLKCIQ